MNIILWLLQIILCIKFISTAYSHGMQPNNSKMEQSINKIGIYGNKLHRIISVMVVIGSVGVLLPALFGLNNQFTIVSSTFLMIMMMLSLIFHIRSRENPVLIADIVLIILSGFVAFGRWKLFPL